MFSGTQTENHGVGGSIPFLGTIISITKQDVYISMRASFWLH